MTLTFFLKKNLIFLASRIPASRFASLDHNCHIFWTQLLLHWTTTITSLDHNCHITETKLFQAEHFKLKSCSVNSMKCNSIVCDCLILSPPLIVAGVYVVVVQ